MKRLNLMGIVRAASAAAKRHTPEILMGLGIAGMISTVVMAVRATPAAMEKCEELRLEKEDNRDEAPTTLEYAKAAWLCYMPTAITGALSIFCLVGSNSANLRRNAALATAYSLSETALKEYREKTAEVVGDKKEKAIRDAVAKEQIEQNPIGSREVVLTGKGETLCYDSISGRYFKSDIDKLKKAANEVNRRMLLEMYVSLNEFYYEIGLKEITVGDELGWNVEKGLMELSFSTQLADEGIPCLVLEYRVAPRYDYR